MSGNKLKVLSYWNLNIRSTVKPAFTLELKVLSYWNLNLVLPSIAFPITSA